ncbi:MAG TPA: hypothetical protein VEK38_03920 [Candidatus Bathyarchaeia archaeon]|nr:hypothetical protein [Candidatus Bathyarchaeia archaeon]
MKKFFLCGIMVLSGGILQAEEGGDSQKKDEEKQEVKELPPVSHSLKNKQSMQDLCIGNLGRYVFDSHTQYGSSSQVAERLKKDNEFNQICLQCAKHMGSKKKVLEELARISKMQSPENDWKKFGPVEMVAHQLLAVHTLCTPNTLESLDKQISEQIAGYLVFLYGTYDSSKARHAAFAADFKAVAGKYNKKPEKELAGYVFRAAQEQGLSELVIIIEGMFPDIKN